MFAPLTQTEQTELFIRLSHAHRAIDRRMGDLIPAPDEKWRPVVDLGAEIVTLMGDLNNSPAAPEAWQAEPPQAPAPEVITWPSASAAGNMHATSLSTAWDTKPGRPASWRFTVACACGWDSDDWASRPSAIEAGLAHCAEAT